MSARVARVGACVARAGTCVCRKCGSCGARLTVERFSKLLELGDRYGGGYNAGEEDIKKKKKKSTERTLGAFKLTVGTTRIIIIAVISAF
jgi:hypothetical protein